LSSLALFDSLNPWVAVAAFAVGLIVGMTGVGGGALMTPVLVLLFRVHPLAAVSSDLVASLFLKPVGAAVHARRGTVNARLVLWLSVGSVPAAFAGVFILRAFGSEAAIDSTLRRVLGVVLVLAAVAVGLRTVLESMRAGGADDEQPIKVHRLRTIAIGIGGGLIVGMTSVGSGSVVIVLLMFLYPRLVGSRLVGTNLAQAVPLVAAAALGHLLYGDFRLALTTALVLGGVPGVYIGSRLSSRSPDVVLKPLVAFVLLATALGLLNPPVVVTGVLLAGALTMGLPLWSAFDAAGWTPEEWSGTGRRRTRWISFLAAGTVLPPAGTGLAIAYLLSVRPVLSHSRARAGANL